MTNGEKLKYYKSLKIIQDYEKELCKKIKEMNKYDSDGYGSSISGYNEAIDDILEIIKNKK